MTTKCPYCKADLEVGEDVAVGQNVTCKYCERKFAYGVEIPKPSRIAIPTGLGKKQPSEAKGSGGHVPPLKNVVDSDADPSPSEDIDTNRNFDERTFPGICKMLYWVLLAVLVVGAVSWFGRDMVLLPGPEHERVACSVDISGEPSVRKDLDADFDAYRDYYEHEEPEFAYEYLRHRRYLRHDFTMERTWIAECVASRWQSLAKVQCALFVALLFLLFLRGLALVVYGIFRNGNWIIQGQKALQDQGEQLRAQHLKASQYVCDVLAEICDNQKGV